MRFRLPFALLILVCVLYSQATAQWVHQTTFPGVGRSMPFCFVVNDKAYIGTGFSAGSQVTVDNYEYNAVANTWATKSVPPFAARMGTFSFSIGSYGYVGSGSTNGGANVLTDFWRYDPGTDSWTQMAPFPGVGRIEAVEFVINNRGYVVSGIRSAGSPLDCWEYNPTTNVWTQKSTPPAGFTAGYGAGFTDGIYGYCGVGGGNSNCHNDFWRYSPGTDSWTQLASLPSPLRTWAIGGLNLVNGKGFVGLGGCSSVSNTDFWVYDAGTNQWQTSAGYTFPTALANTRSFFAGGSLYVGTGSSGPAYENRIFKFVRPEACTAPPAGMTGWWPMDEASISPGSTTEDLTGNPTAYIPTTFLNTGTVVGNVLSVTGEVGKAFEFSGTGSDYVSVPNQADLNVGAGDFTLDAWVKLDNINGIRVIADKRSNTPAVQTKGWSFFFSSGFLAIQIGSTPGAYMNYIAPGPVLAPGRWYHVAAAIDRDDPQGGRLYVDGQLVHTFNPVARAGLLDVVEPMIIGSSVRGFQAHAFDGAIDELELFKRALSGQEIAAIYNAGSAGKCKKVVDTCCVEREVIGTGWDHATGSTSAIGSLNPFWQIVADPDPNTTEPRAANVVYPYGYPNSQAWQNPIPGSQWIGSTTGTSTSGVAGTYEYKACFCLCDRPKGSRLRLLLDLRADDRASIFVNNSSTPILTTPSGWSFASVNPSHFEGFIDQYVDSSATSFCLSAKVVNDGGPMGLNIGGYIEVVDANGRPYPGIMKVTCCAQTAVITGTKFWDKDCNGVQDTGESPLPGWTISADGVRGLFMGTTKADGTYQISLPPGSYTLTEGAKPGWVQCSPVAPANQITVGGGGTATINFGNNHVPPDRCFIADSITTVCRFDSTTGRQYYDLKTSLRTFLNCNNAPQYGQIVGAFSSAGALTVTPGGTFPVSTSPLQQSFALSGSGAAPGALVKLVLRVCCASQEAGYQDYCCTDTITARLPAQSCAPQGCLEIVDDSVHCVVGPDGVTRWTYCFRVRNSSFFPASYLTLNGAGISFSPATVSLGTLAPGAVSSSYCITVNAAGPGYYPVSVLMQNARRTFKCGMEFKLELPDCPVISCCPGFAKFDASLKPWASNSSTASPWGNVGVQGTLTAVGTEKCRRMTKVEVTIENASINGSPTYAYFANSFLPQEIGGLGAGVVTTSPYGQRVVWGPMTPRIVSGSTNLRLVFPPTKGFKEKLSWCIRYRFTDECCNTCDTVICYSTIRQIPRYPWPPIKGGVDWYKGNEKKGTEVQSAPSIGQIVTNDSAFMNITLPEIPGAHFVGMTVTVLDSGVTLRDVTPTPENLLFLTPEGVAVAEFDLPGNTDLTLGLKYNDFGPERKAIRHAVSIFYKIDSAPDERLEMGGEITLYRPGSEGGDVVDSTITDESHVKTYTLHLQNANASKQPIARLALRVHAPQKILAVGPTANDTTVAIAFRKVDENGNYIVAEGRGEEVVVPVDGQVSPIYLTVAGVEGETVLVDFVTLDEGGEVLSEGSVTLSPIGSVASEGGVTGGFLSQSYPNPTDGSATIEFLLPRTERNVTLIVTDERGNEVARLIDGTLLHSGLHAVYFDGAGLPSGTYYYTLRTAQGRETKGLQLVR